MISVIISSKSPLLFNNLKLNIHQTIGTEYEIIKIENYQGLYSISEAYNSGAEKANFNILCFCHEDIIFHTQAWGEKLINHFKNPEITLIGILGNTVKSVIPSGVYSSAPNTVRINQLQRMKDGSTIKYYVNPFNEQTSEVAVLDGMILCTKLEHWKRFKFDTTIIKGFHGYDIDFSLSMNKIGKVIVTYDILLEHFSFGGNTVDWVNSQEAIIKKWSKYLPLIKSNATKKMLKDREIEDLIDLLKTLNSLSFPLYVRLRYLLRLFFINPFHKYIYSTIKILLK